MEFRILGPVEVAGPGGPIRLGSRRERAVLAALVIVGGRVVSADRLMDALWADDPPRSAAKTLQNYVLKLRKALGPDVIATQAPGYRLAPDGDAIDAGRFEELIRAAGAARADGRPADAVPLARDALALWRGTPLEELQGWAVADAEAARLSELHRVAAEELVDAELACGSAATVVAELEAMVSAEPLREHRWAMLMLALYRDGRQADALRTFQRARTMLGDELGIEPGPELRALERAIAEQDPALEAAAAPVHASVDDGCDDADAPPPYLGLAAFGPEDHARFFGRATLVAELVRRAVDTPFVAVIGASGSGKSSLVRAGVVASLRAGAHPGCGSWPVVVTAPGARPMVELAAALAPVVGRSASEVLERLTVDPRHLVDLARATLPSDARLVVVVDQFEELFTLARDDRERRAFVDVLVAAAHASDGPVTTVVAVRADFYGHCAEFPDLAAQFDDGSTLLCPMAPDDIRAAIEGPAELAGLHVEPGLTELVLRDVGDEPGALPLLSHALLETWRRRARRTLTVEAYRAAGGVRGAIAQTAESVYRALDPDDQVRARRVFLRLTELGDGTEDTSRRVERHELAETVDGSDTEVVIDRLARARLVTVDGGTVQVAHEALIREWPRLRSWLDQDRDGHRLHRHLTHAARDWAALGHDPAELYRGTRLASVREWLDHDDHRDGLNTLEVAFVDASVVREDAERSAQAEQVRTRERSHRRLRRLSVTMAVVLVVALVAGALALVQRNRADSAAGDARATSRTADISRLVAQSSALRSENQYVSALLAVEANRRHDDAQTQGALLSAVVAEPRRLLTLRTGPSSALWSLPGKSTVLVLSGDRLGLWDVHTGRGLGRLPVDHMETAAVRADGLIAAARTDGTVVFLDATGRRSGALSTGLRGPLAAAAFSPDGHLLAIGYGNWADPAWVAASSTVRLFDVDGRTPGPTLPGTSALATALAFSSDGRRLAIGTADDRVVLRDTSTGAAVGSPITTSAPPIGLAFDPTRDRLAIGTIGPGVDVVTPATGKRVGQLVDAPSVDAPVYNAAGDTLAVAGNGPVRLYDAESLTPIPNKVAADFAPAVPTGESLDTQIAQARVAFAPEGRVVVAGTTGPTTVWDPQGTSALDRAIPGTALSYVFPMAGDRVVAWPDLADSVTLFDRRTLRPTGPPLTPGPGAELAVTLPTTFAASYYDGSRIAVVNRSGLLQLFETATGHPIGPPVATRIAPVYAVFSRDMRTIAVSGRQGEVRLVDVRTHAVRALPSPMTNLVFGLEFGPHGVLAASDAGHVVLYSHLGSAHPRMRDASRATHATGFGMDLSPDGRMLAVATTGNSIGFFDARTLHRIGPVVPTSGNSITWVAFDRTGTKVVTGDVANVARLIDVPSRRQIGPPLVNNVAGGGSVFSDDGRTLGTWTFDTGALMSLDPAVWRREACAIAGRNLTADEWSKYLPGQGPRRRTCARYP